MRYLEGVHGARLDLEEPIGGSPRSLGRDFLQKWSEDGYNGQTDNDNDIKLHKKLINLGLDPNPLWSDVKGHVNAEEEDDLS